MEKRYRALRTIATIFKVLGWIVLIVGILSACVMSGATILGGAIPLMGGTGQRGGGELTLMVIVMAVVMFIGTLITVGLYALILIAGAEGIYVFLDIEQNTREMVRRLGQMGGSAGLPPPT